MKHVVRFLIVAVSCGLAAAECDLDKVKGGGRETDKTNLVRKGTKGMDYAFGHDGEAAYLRVLYARHFKARQLIDETTPLTFSLADGTEVTLKPMHETASKWEGPILLGSKVVRLRYALPDESLRVLAQVPIRSVSFAFREPDRGPDADVHEVKDKKAARFAEAAACLLTERGG